MVPESEEHSELSHNHLWSRPSESLSLALVVSCWKDVPQHHSQGKNEAVCDSPCQRFQFLQQTAESKWNNRRACGSGGPSLQCRSAHGVFSGPWHQNCGETRAKELFQRSCRGERCHIMNGMLSWGNWERCSSYLHRSP